MIVNPFSYLIEKLKGKVNKSGDTMTGELHINVSSGDAFLETKHTSTNNAIAFGVGNGGINRGIYDKISDRWLFRHDNTNVYVNATKVPYNGGTLATLNDTKINTASNWNEALSNAKEYIVFVGKGTDEKGNSVCVTLFIPMLSLTNTQIYYMNSIQYASGGSYANTVLQAKLSKTQASNIGLYTGNPSSLVSDATYTIYYR